MLHIMPIPEQWTCGMMVLFETIVKSSQFYKCAHSFSFLFLSVKQNKKPTYNFALLKREIDPFSFVNSFDELVLSLAGRTN